MNSASLNSRPFIVPSIANSQFAYLSSLPTVNSLNLQLSFAQQWNSAPLQWNSNHNLLRQFMMSQSMLNPLMRNTTTLNRAGFENVSNMQREMSQICKEENNTEGILKKEEYFSVKDTSSSDEELSQEFETKAELKVEESEDTEEKFQYGWQESNEMFNCNRIYKSYEACEDKYSESPDNGIKEPEVNRQMDLKSQIKEMVKFMVEHFGMIRQTDLIKERMKYQFNPILSKLFEVLYAKYSCTFKTRAEIVKYITRKAFSTIKSKSKKKSESNPKEICKALCQRYFQQSSEEIQNSGIDIENRERFLQLLFPYQKNSKNKVQDTELISKLMSSKEFYEDYCLYIQDLDSILETDNNRKLTKFVTFILSCISKGQLGNIMKYKRVPWLKGWLDNTKIVAKELAFSIQRKSQQKSSKRNKIEKISNKRESNQVSDESI